MTLVITKLHATYDRFISTSAATAKAIYWKTAQVKWDTQLLTCDTRWDQKVILYKRLGDKKNSILVPCIDNVCFSIIIKMSPLFILKTRS